MFFYKTSRNHASTDINLSHCFYLEEVATYLKPSQELVEQLAQNGTILGRKIESSWRFLRTAIDDWLSGRDGISLSDIALLNTNIDGTLITIRQLSLSDKLKLLRVLAEALDTTENIFSFETEKTYYLSTPYNIFGAVQALMDALGLM